MKKVKRGVTILIAVLGLSVCILSGVIHVKNQIEPPVFPNTSPNFPLLIEVGDEGEPPSDYKPHEIGWTEPRIVAGVTDENLNPPLTIRRILTPRKALRVLVMTRGLLADYVYQPSKEVGGCISTHSSETVSFQALINLGGIPKNAEAIELYPTGADTLYIFAVSGGRVYLFRMTINQNLS